MFFKWFAVIDTLIHLFPFSVYFPISSSFAFPLHEDVPRLRPASFFHFPSLLWAATFALMVNFIFPYTCWWWLANVTFQSWPLLRAPDWKAKLHFPIGSSVGALKSQVNLLILCSHLCPFSQQLIGTWSLLVELNLTQCANTIGQAGPYTEWSNSPRASSLGS